MRTWSVVVALNVVLLAACGGSKPAPAPEPIANKTPPPPPDAAPPDASSALDAAMHQMAEFTQRMCACRDSSCAQQVAEDMTKWSQEVSRDPALENMKPTEEQMKQMTDITKQMTDCMTKAMSAPAGSGSAASPPPPSP